MPAPERCEPPPRQRRMLVALVTTLVAWFVAFLIAYALLALLGRTLASLPRALDALIFTGVLVPVMGNLVMPVAGRTVGSRLGRPTAPGSATDRTSIT